MATDTSITRFQSYDGEGHDLGMLTLAEANRLGGAEYDDESGTITVDLSGRDLCDYVTGQYIREATTREARASAYAAQTDGGAGVILVAEDGRILDADDAGADDARRVYVQG